MSKTTDQFKKTYYKVRHNSHGASLQNAMFALGFKWPSGRQTVSDFFSRSGYLYVDENCRIMWSGDSLYPPQGDFSYKEKTFTDLYRAEPILKAEKREAKKEHRKRRALRKAGWTTHKADGNCPLPADTKIKIKMQCGGESSGYNEASMWHWDGGQDGTIVGYKIKEEVKAPEAKTTFAAMVDDILVSADAKEVDSDGFIIWKGGVCPVPKGTKVDVKYRVGPTRFNLTALLEDTDRNATQRFWDNDSHGSDIVAYRVSAAVGGDVPADLVFSAAPDTETVAVGDVNSSARGSGARFNAGKADLSLIPMKLLEGEARVWMYGAKKYSAWNWMKGMDWSVPFACAMRHMSAWQSGEDIDSETGESHLDHAMCNLRMLRYYADFYKEGDNRPKEFFNGME